jgi:hypothetical protein
MHAHKKYVDEELLKIESRQKEIMAKNDMPHSPLPAPMDFPPPPTFHNPSEEIGSSSTIFGAPQMEDNDFEEYFGRREESDDEEKEVPIADTPTDGEEEDDE